MASAQSAEARKRVIVQVNKNDEGAKRLLIAGIAAVVSIGFHGALILLLLNLPQNQAKADDTPSGEVTKPRTL